VIHVWGAPDPPAPRLVDALRQRGHAFGAEKVPAADAPATLVLAAGNDLDPMALGVLLGGWRYARGARVLVISRLGAHPDARAKSLRALWELEEHVRSTGMRSVTLRLAPLLGPQSPLWLKLRSAPRLPGGGRARIQPVEESDAVEAISRLLSDQVSWEGWFEIAGRESFTLAELVELAATAGPRALGAGAWEPPLAEMAEHRLAEPDHWLERFAMRLRPLREAVSSWPV